MMSSSIQSTFGGAVYVPLPLRNTCLVGRVRLAADSEQVPEEVNVPPSRPVPQVTLLTVPIELIDTQEGNPLAFS